MFAGVTLISLALCADGVIGNVQEKAMKQHGARNTEVVGDIENIDCIVLCSIAYFFCSFLVVGCLV